MNVKKIIQDKKIDPKDFARELDVSVTHVYNMMDGKTFPSLKLMKKIRQTYDMPLGSD